MVFLRDCLIGLMRSGENFVDSGLRTRRFLSVGGRPGRSSAVSLGRKLELGLGVGSCRGNGWRPGRHAEHLRAGLAGSDPSDLELLLIERICCCWLAVQHADVVEFECGGATLPEGEYVQRRHDRAHRRFLSACKALAQVRKLLGPNIQVNVAEQQVNIA